MNDCFKKFQNKFNFAFILMTVNVDFGVSGSVVTIKQQFRQQSVANIFKIQKTLDYRKSMWNFVLNCTVIKWDILNHQVVLFETQCSDSISRVRIIQSCISEIWYKIIKITRDSATKERTNIKYLILESWLSFVFP